MPKARVQTEIYIVVHTMSRQLTVTPTSASVESGKGVRWTLLAYSGELSSPDQLVPAKELVPAKDQVPAKEKRKYQITVTIPGGEFLLLFDEVAAFGTPQLRSERGRGDLQAESKGTYHYRVAAAVDGRVYADLYCPSIIIH